MATLAQPPVSRKPAPRAYYAHLDDQPGTLAQLDGVIYFMEDVTHAQTVITPAHVPFLAVLGEIGLADCQQIMDRLHGGAGAIACHRAQEVQ